MTIYAAEQGPSDGRVMEDDLRPWLRSRWGADAILSEFPYHRYRDDSHPEVREYARIRDCDPSGVTSDYARQEGPFRTDLVAVSADREALQHRADVLGHLTPLNQPKAGKRKYRRTYLNFVKDGPMEREYYETYHGTSNHGPTERRGYSSSVSRTAFGWLKKRNFLAEHPAGGWDAVALPLHIDAAHAVELKRHAAEWETAIEQASRADVFADYRWVAYDASAMDDVLAHREAFEAKGVGLLAVSPEEVRVVIEADCCTPALDGLLNRYMVERWDLNERLLTRIDAAVTLPDDPASTPPLVHPSDASVRRTADGQGDARLDDFR